MTRFNALFGVVLLGACGCGGESASRRPLSGSVTIDGRPLVGGHIQFEPMTGQPTQSGGLIVAGRFDVPREVGADPGRYAVAIFSAADSADVAVAATPEADVRAAKPDKQSVPRRYNTDTELTVEVTTDGANEFRFELSGSPKP